MTVPFWCLFVAVLLPIALSFVGGAYRARQFGTIDNRNPRAQQALMEGAGARAVAAQKNAWEALPVFASAVFVAHLAGAAPGTSATLSIVWVVARIVHPICYIADLDKLRSLSFLVALACVIGLFLISA